MNEPKVWDLDYINFLLATPRVVSATEGARVQPEGERRRRVTKPGLVVNGDALLLIWLGCFDLVAGLTWLGSEGESIYRCARAIYYVLTVVTR